MLNLAHLPGKLGAKINGILLLFFLFALTMIIATLYVGRQLEGGAAAINEAGAERMRTYRIAYLLVQSLDDEEHGEDLIAEARLVFNSLESALTLLEEGDSERPLFLPRETRVRNEMLRLRDYWDTRLRPLMLLAMDTVEASERRVHVRRIDDAVREFVPIINELVLLVERSNAKNTNLMWIYQNALVGFALAGTLFLSFLFTVLVIRPVEDLKKGVESMAAANFDARVPVMSVDEFGELAKGFNQMADYLRGFYDTLEQRVADKTRDIEERNKELAALYDIAAYLAKPAEIGTVCRGVLEKLRALLGAEAGAVRLLDLRTQEMEIIASVNLSERFLEAEARLPANACLCGRAVSGAGAVIRPCNYAEESLQHCKQEGLPAMVAIPIRSKNQIFGIFNLFFLGSRQPASNEIKLLEAIGQHLGVTIENLRLAVREKDMAVSEERNLLAQELHDSIAQSLAFLNIQAQMLHGSLRAGHSESAIQELMRMREGIQESYDNVRELLAHFRIKVEHADLEDAIRSTLEKFEGQTGIRTSLQRSGNVSINAAGSILQILHIIQEALSNIRKHADATCIDVSMQNEGTTLVVSVRDDGVGFMPESVNEMHGAHVGIGIMRERAHRIGANFLLESEVGQGTCVTLRIPMTALT